MSRSVNGKGSRLAWWALSAASIAAAWYAVSMVVDVDAMAAYRIDKSEPESPGIRMNDADFKSYRKGRMTIEAHAAVMAVTKDRSRATLTQVTEGVFYPEKGDPYHFEAARANYHNYRHTLTVDAGARIYQDEDMDIRTPEFTFLRNEDLLEAPGRFTGILGGGEVDAENLIMSPKAETISAGPINWKGKASLQEQDEQAQWEFDAEQMDADGDIWVYTAARATDGEVIIRAKKITHNRDTDVLVAEGDVKFFGEESNLSCPKATIYRKEKRVVLENGVNLLIKAEEEQKLEEVEIPPLTPYVPDELKANRPLPPKDDPERSLDDQVRDTENLRDYPVTVLSEKIEYWYDKGSRKAIITGSPQARQELPEGRWRMIWAHRADFDGEKDWLTLTSREGNRDARLKGSTGDDYQAIEFGISTKKDVEKMSAKSIRGVSPIDDEEKASGGGGGIGGGLSGPIG
jgi:hypothetical protein